MDRRPSSPTRGLFDDCRSDDGFSHEDGPPEAAAPGSMFELQEALQYGHGGGGADGNGEDDDRGSTGAGSEVTQTRGDDLMEDEHGQAKSRRYSSTVGTVEITRSTDGKIQTRLVHFGRAIWAQIGFIFLGLLLVVTGMALGLYLHEQMGEAVRADPEYLKTLEELQERVRHVEESSVNFRQDPWGMEYT